MSGDTKTRNRTKGNADQADPYAESKQELQNALLKDYLASKQSLAAADKETKASPLVEQHETSAARLEALLEAARQQQDAKADPTNKPPTDVRRREPKKKRLPPAPPNLPPNPQEIFLAKSDMRTAGEGTRAETEFATAVDVEVPSSGATVVSFPRLAIRTAVVAVIVVASAYAVFAPHWTEGDGTKPVDVTDALVSAPAADVTEAASPPPGAVDQVSTPKNVPAAMTVPAMGAVADSESKVPAVATAVSAEANDEAPAQNTVQGDVQPAVQAPVGPRNSPTRSDSARAADSVQPLAPPPGMASAGKAVGDRIVATESDKAVAIPPPPPSQLVATPVAATPATVTGDGTTVETVSVPAADGTSGTPAPDADKAPPPEAVALEKQAPEKRPYFRRLGPHPPNNPFRAASDIPAPPPAKYDFFEYYGEIE